MRYTFILDASYDYEIHVAGIGLVIHQSNNPKKNKNGIIIDEICESYIGIHSGKIEMFAVYRALEIAIERGYRSVRTRSDYNYMRKSLNQSYKNNCGHGRGDLHGEIMRMTNKFENVDFGYKPRRKNQMAHNLTREAVKEVEPILRNDLVNLCKASEIMVNFHNDRGLRNKRERR